MSEKRRALRADVRKRIRGVFLKCPELSPRDIRVINISEYGVGVESTGFIRRLKGGEIFDARLIVGHTAAPVRLKVVRAGEDFSGLEIIQPSQLFQGAIRTFFQPELVGAAMKEDTVPKSGGSSGNYRYTDGENFLELEVQHSELQSLTIDVLGNSIEWKSGDTLRLFQNSIEQPVDDFLRKQLIKFVHSIVPLSPANKKLAESVLQIR